LEKSEAARTIAKTAKNNQHVTFLLTPEIKKLLKNAQTPELCLKMILEHRTLLVLTITSAKIAENN